MEMKLASIAETLRLKLAIPNADRIFHLAQALQDGMSIDEIYDLTKIDRWFLQNLKQIVEETRFVAGRACVSRAAPDVSSGALSKRAEGAPDSAQRDAVPHVRDANATQAENVRYSRRRIPHFERPWAKYTLTFATDKRKPLTPSARTIILNAIKYFDERRYELYAACVMPDHVHILFEPGIKEEDKNGNPVFWSLGELVGSIKSFTAHEINKRAETKGAVWEEEWHDRLIRSDKDLEEKFFYITRNPWDAGIVRTDEDYEHVWWSDKDNPDRAESRPAR